MVAKKKTTPALPPVGKTVTKTVMGKPKVHTVTRHENGRAFIKVTHGGKFVSHMGYTAPSAHKLLGK